MQRISYQIGIFKILTLSKNTLQNLTVTNAKANVPNLTTVRYFLPYGKILKCQVKSTKTQYLHILVNFIGSFDDANSYPENPGSDKKFN